MIDMNKDSSYKYLYAELNNKVRKKLYKGLSTSTARVDVDNVNSTISVNVTNPAAYKIKKLKDYTYEIVYDAIDYDFAEKYFLNPNVPYPTGNCSSFRKNELIVRSFDWLYNNCASFRVITKTPWRVCGTSNGPTKLTQEFVDTNKTDELYKILPFYLMDGMNEYGVFTECNVVPTDFGINDNIIPNGRIEKTLSAIMLNRYILDTFTSATDAINYITEHIKIIFPEALHKMNYETHWQICDKTDTYLLEIINNHYQITHSYTNDIDNNISTNFYKYNVVLNADKTVYTPITKDDEHNAIITNHITEHGSGLERYNIIVNNYDNITNINDVKSILQNIKYTNTYTNQIGNNFWYTEYVGEQYNVATDVSLFNGIIPKYIEAYNNRDRNNPLTWQSVHSVIYDVNNCIVYLYTQEDFNNEFKCELKKIDETIVPKTNNLLKGDNSGGIIPAIENTDYVTNAYTNTLINNKINLHNQTQNAHYVGYEQNRNFSEYLEKSLNGKTFMVPKFTDEEFEYYYKKLEDEHSRLQCISSHGIESSSVYTYETDLYLTHSEYTADASHRIYGFITTASKMQQGLSEDMGIAKIQYYRQNLGDRYDTTQVEIYPISVNDYISYNPQTLTTSQITQARQNLGILQKSVSFNKDTSGFTHKGCAYFNLIPSTGYSYGAYYQRVTAPYENSYNDVKIKINTNHAIRLTMDIEDQPGEMKIVKDIQPGQDQEITFGFGMLYLNNSPLRVYFNKQITEQVSFEITSFEVHHVQIIGGGPGEGDPTYKDTIVAKNNFEQQSGTTTTWYAGSCSYKTLPPYQLQVQDNDAGTNRVVMAAQCLDSLSNTQVTVSKVHSGGWVIFNFDSDPFSQYPTQTVRYVMIKL